VDSAWVRVEARNESRSASSSRYSLRSSSIACAPR